MAAEAPRLQGPTLPGAALHQTAAEADDHLGGCRENAGFTEGELVNCSLTQGGTTGVFGGEILYVFVNEPLGQYHDGE